MVSAPSRNRRLKVENRGPGRGAPAPERDAAAARAGAERTRRAGDRQISTRSTTSARRSGANLELQPRLRRIARDGGASWSSASGAVVYLHSEDSGEFRGVAAHRRRAAAASRTADRTSAPARGAAGQGRLGTGRGAAGQPRAASASSCPAVLGPIAHEVLAVPMVQERQAIGVLVVLDRAEGFSEDDVEFLALFADAGRGRGAQLAAVRAHQELDRLEVRLRGGGVARDPHAADLGQGRARTALRRALLPEHRAAGQAADHRARERRAPAGADQRHPRLLASSSRRRCR